MGAMSFTHILLLLVVVLLFFGPSRLPTLGKSMGEAIRGFKKGLDGAEIDVTPAQHEKLNAQAQDSVTKQTTSEKDKA